MHHEPDSPRPIRRTEADAPSDTRFGPRPVPPGHRGPHDAPESRRIPPHGAVSPDGSRPWPQPSRSARWLVWGGTALTAAALTAGTVIAARQVMHALSDPSPHRDLPPKAQRMAAMPDPEREALRRRAETRDRAEDARAEQLRAAAAQARPRPRKPAPRVGLMQEIEANTASLTKGVDNVMQALTAGMTGFRTVAAQASDIMREFGDAAALVQDILGRSRPAGSDRSRRDPPRPDDRHGVHMPDLRDDPLTHDPLDGPDADTPQDHDPRMHRL
ncbi:hypothetical protein [Paracoccus sp. DMF]|uniref:hypothetical protein n=1 Tax=Paracoccus sp. DMF TaxID=400837 RepID=UPI0021E4283B|nr:hypothetical protein [Paracoccus sp. DMF]MCV2446871.1 hypothetical protein [Paracoccus sp. DMF]